jgi:hypothetical protein
MVDVIIGALLPTIITVGVGFVVAKIGKMLPNRKLYSITFGLTWGMAKMLLGTGKLKEKAWKIIASWFDNLIGVASLGIRDGIKYYAKDKKQKDVIEERWKDKVSVVFPDKK